MAINIVLYVMNSQEMVTSNALITSRKHKRNKEEMEELEEQAISVVACAVDILFGVMTFGCKNRDKKRIIFLMKEVTKSLKEFVQEVKEEEEELDEQTIFIVVSIVVNESSGRVIEKISITTCN